MRTVAIVNQKGGSGKTTTAINLSAALARRGARTLLVDLDPQGHSGLGLAIPESQAEVQIGDALLAPTGRPLDLSRLVWHVARDLDLIPSTKRLAALEAPRGGLADHEDRDTRLAAFLGQLRETYEWCLIDCPPSIGLLTYNALRASTHVLIPVETAFFALQGAASQVATIQSLGRRSDTHIPYWILPTLHDPESQLAADVLGELHKRFADHVLPLTVRIDARLKEAASLGIPVGELDAQSPGALDYAELASRLMCLLASGSRQRRARSDSEDSDSPNRECASTKACHAHAMDTPSEPMLVVTAGGAPLAGASRRSAPLTRAAELAARARRLAARSAELTRRLEADPDVSRFMHEATVSGEAPSAHAASRPGRLQSLRRVFGASPTARGVLFVHPAPATSTVCVAGDHNNWSPTATAMRFNAELCVHEVCVPMEPGRHRYRLVVDGRWMADAHNPLREPNPFGEEDSVIVVEPAGAKSIATADA